MDGWVAVWLDEQLAGWMDSWINEWTDLFQTVTHNIGLPSLVLPSCALQWLSFQPC